jgi:hypothetical protein
MVYLKVNVFIIKKATNMNLIKQTFIISIILITAYGCFPKPCPICEKGNTAYGWTSGNFLGQWDDYYACGLSYIEGRCFDKAIWALKKALLLRDQDQWMARSYGMHFVDYFPHRELGLCYYELGNLKPAIQELETSISQEKSDKALYYLDQTRKKMMESEHQLPKKPEIVLDVPDTIHTNKASIILSGKIFDPQYIETIHIAGEPYVMASSKKQVVFARELFLPEGLHEISVCAKNLLGGLNKKEITIHVDKTGPVIIVQSFKPGKRVLGIIQDNNTTISLTINGKKASIESGKKVSFDIALTEQSPVITLRATDIAGNETIAFLKCHHQNADLKTLRLAWRAPDFIADNGEYKIKTTSLKPEIDLYGWSKRNIVYKKDVYIEGEIKSTDPICFVSINQIPVFNERANMLFLSKPIELMEGDNQIVIQAMTQTGAVCRHVFSIHRKIPIIFHLQQRYGFLIHPFDHFQKHKRIKAFQELFFSKLFKQKRFQLFWNKSDHHVFEGIHSNESQHDIAAEAALFGYCYVTKNGLEIITRIVDIKSSRIIAMNDAYAPNSDPHMIEKLANEMREKMSRTFPLMEGTGFLQNQSIIVQPVKWFPEKGRLKVNCSLIVFQKLKELFNPITDKSLGYDTKILGITHVNKRFEDGCYQTTAIDMDTIKQTFGVMSR